MQKIVIAITGASGVIYAKRLLDKLFGVSNIEVHIVVSENAKQVISSELSDFRLSSYNFKVWENNDFDAPFASGSARFGSMVVCPCSMASLSRIANGAATDLITRAADVMLKERGRLIIVPREMPFNLIHIRNMESATLAGAIICPAMPSFYSCPQTIDELADTVVNRILDLLCVANDGFSWGKV